MRVIIVGCGRIGSALADLMYKKRRQVTVIDQDEEAFDNLSIDFHGRTILGDVLSRSVLRRAEIEHADALAAVTRSDSLNALAAHIARAEYKVARVVARNYDPRQRALQEAFKIPVVGSAIWRVQRIEELLSDELLQGVFLDSDAHFAMHRLIAPPAWEGRSLGSCLPGEQFQVLSWSRRGERLSPDGDQAVRVEDVFYLSASAEAIEALRKLLPPGEEPSR